MKRDEEISFEYKPIKKIIIHSMYETDYESFIKDIFTYEAPQNIFWAGGYLFRVIPIQIDGNVDVMKDFINGIAHWEEVTYCKAKRPENLIIKEGALEAKITDVSEVYPYSKFISWLKTVDKG